VSVLTLKSSHCAYCTVIHSCVLCGHRTQLQGELFLGHVSGDGDVTFQGWAVVIASTITYVCHPFQALPWSLADTAPIVITGNGVTRDSTGEGHGL
jgi:hypothetical protein